ncbi:MAG: fluoride efflux transporter CrcB [Candidatus Symbiothrix sp.]|jgi:CrcB protein|nr:fluoride efflux transporter CrcB [Candidatus Symbiothrix sp.]
MIKQILLVGLGGGIGSILRFLASQLTIKTSSFPIATFTVNLLGCLLIGILIGLSLKNQWLDANMRVLLITGFCGGFTTFSTFSLENVQMYQAGNYTGLIFYTLASVIIGFAAVWMGLSFTK